MTGDSDEPRNQYTILSPSVRSIRSGIPSPLLEYRAIGNAL